MRYIPGMISFGPKRSGGTHHIRRAPRHAKGRTMIVARNPNTGYIDGEYRGTTYLKQVWAGLAQASRQAAGATTGMAGSDARITAMNESVGSALYGRNYGRSLPKQYGNVNKLLASVGQTAAARPAPRRAEEYRI